MLDARATPRWDPIVRANMLMNARPLALGGILCAVLGPIALAACGAGGGNAPEATAETGEATAAIEGAPRAATTTAKRHRGIARLHARDANGKIIEKLPSCTNPKLAYYGGPILQNPVVVPVFWSSAVNSEVIQKMPSFYSDIEKTGWWSWLHEYDTVTQTGGSSQVILTGSSVAGVTLVPSRCATSSSCKVTDDELQTELNAQIQSGTLPAPTVDCTGNTNTVYMVHFPPNVTVDGPDGSGTSCVDFCGYHNTGTVSSGSASGKPLVYAVLADTYSGGCSSGCGANTDPFDNQTSVSSHELAEATTDTDIGLLPESATQIAAPVGWYDENNMCGEIGDICDDGTTPGTSIQGASGSWIVQPLWSNVQGKCVTSGTVATICSGTTTTSCRMCSCGDNGTGCSGSTAACETDSSNPLYGACEQCTSTTTCPGGGTCTSNDTCMGGCTPKTSCPSGFTCGSTSDGCGGTITCGTCSGSETCTNNSCSSGSCTPITKCPSGFACGTTSDGCGGTLDCGTCSGTDTCTNNACEAAGCVPETSCPTRSMCGTASDGCGGTLDCGSCNPGEVCTDNLCLVAGSTGTGSAASGASSSGLFPTSANPSGCAVSTSGEGSGRSGAVALFFALAGLAGASRRRRR